jgi:hypothetical protein
MELMNPDLYDRPWLAALLSPSEKQSEPRRYHPAHVYGLTGGTIRMHACGPMHRENEQEGFVRLIS